MKPSAPADREAVKHRNVVSRFRDAFRGFYQAYREEPNLRFHVFAGSCSAVAGYAVGLDGWETAYLAVSITLVMFAEMVNTGIERAVDTAVGGRWHPLAAQAKQVAAGAVLLASLHAAVAAALLFMIQRSLPHTLGAIIALLRGSPWLIALPFGTGVLGLLGGGKYGPEAG